MDPVIQANILRTYVVGQNRQSPIASVQRTRSTLAGHSAVPRGFRGRYELQRTLAIRIAAITLASDSAITIARFRPSKLRTYVVGKCCRHTGPDLTIRIGVKDRIAELLLSQYVLGFWGPFKPRLDALNQAKTAT